MRSSIWKNAIGLLSDFLFAILRLHMIPAMETFFFSERKVLLRRGARGGIVVEKEPTEFGKDYFQGREREVYA